MNYDASGANTAPKSCHRDLLRGLVIGSGDTAQRQCPAPAERAGIRPALPYALNPVAEKQHTRHRADGRGTPGLRAIRGFRTPAQLGQQCQIGFGQHTGSRRPRQQIRAAGQRAP